MTAPPTTAEPDASFIFDARNDLSLMLAMYRMGGKAREDALRAADEHCRRAGHEPLNQPNGETK